MAIINLRLVLEQILNLVSADSTMLVSTGQSFIAPVTLMSLILNLL